MPHQRRGPRARFPAVRRGESRVCILAAGPASGLTRTSMQATKFTRTTISLVAKSLFMPTRAMKPSRKWNMLSRNALSRDSHDHPFQQKVMQNEKFRSGILIRNSSIHLTRGLCSLFPLTSKEKGAYEFFLKN